MGACCGTARQEEGHGDLVHAGTGGNSHGQPVEDAPVIRQEGMKMTELLLGIEAFDFLEREGFSVLKSVLVQDEIEAAGVAAAMGFPVALKISSPHAIHKTEVEGVALYLSSQDAVTEGFRQIKRTFGARCPDARPDGIIVQKQGDGLELIIGVLNDQQFGPVLMFGLGGIFAEAMKDVSFRLIPIDIHDAWATMEDLRGYEALKNPRKSSVDLAAIAHFLVRLSNCACNHPEILEVDLNPVFVSSQNVVICDARIKIGPR
jgi:hypothetical protein